MIQKDKPMRSIRRLDWFIVAVFFAILVSLFVRVASGWNNNIVVVDARSSAGTAAEARHTYSTSVAKTYDYKFGKAHPFYPSNATTNNGEFMNPTSFPTAAYCGHCHSEAHEQWRQSAHSNSARAPWYLRNVNLLKSEKGIAFTRHCEGCHNPLATLAGALTEGQPDKRQYDEDGITCMTCHSIQQANTQGTGSYVMAPPAVMVDEIGEPLHRQVSDTELLAHLDRHKTAVMKPFYKTSEFCSACHKAALPQTLNGYKWQRAMSPYDEWQMSAFAKQSPLPFYTKESVSTCQACHMRREASQVFKPGEKVALLASHRWVGANTFVPQFYNYPDQLAAVLAFLRKDVFSIDFFGLQTETLPYQSNHTITEALKLGIAENATLIAPLGSAQYKLSACQYVVITLVIQNKGIAHSHVPEQRDMYESWVDLTVADSSGKILARSGALQPEGQLDPAAHSFTSRLVNKSGNLNNHHEVWNNRTVVYNNSIQAGRSQVVRYGFTLPLIMDGGVTITASVKYRRFAPHFIDFAMNEENGQHYAQDIVEMVSASRILYAGQTLPTEKTVEASKDWMRWNNYGVALLDAQQYRASVAAFEHVSGLRPEYPDAFTNMAIAQTANGDYEVARSNLTKALSLAETDSASMARALYYLAVVEKNQGDFKGALVGLLRVSALYPRSRDIHRELGFCYYKEKRYDLAQSEYEKVQSIDPDDIAAHYNLAAIYRLEGKMYRAAQQEGYFADEKDDPAANMLAVDYLEKDPNIARESIPWHLHDLDLKAHFIKDSDSDRRDLSH